MTPITPTAVRDQRGTALVTALVVLMICMLLGLAVASTSETPLRASGTERRQDSSFELAEGVLYAQGFLLPGNWPGSAVRAFPTSCSSANAADVTNAKCPDRNTLAAANAADASKANFSSADYQAAYGQACPTGVIVSSDVTCWQTEIRDDGYPLCTAFKASEGEGDQSSCDVPGGATTCTGPCTWDANHNGTVWAYARTFVHGQPRAMAAKLKLETLNEGVASAGFRVGHFSTDNNGNKAILDATGAQVLVNCDPSSSCVNVGKKAQVTPSPAQISGGNTFMTATQLAHFKATAEADGRYYSGCPTDNDLSGRVVWVENCDASYTDLASVRCDVPTQDGNAKCINTPAGQDGDCTSRSCAGMLGGPGPGLLIWHHGTLSLGGNVTFVGTIYMPNGSDDGSSVSGTVFSTAGTAAVYGSLAIDGDGGAMLGASGSNFIYDPNSAGVFKSYGTAGLVQNTWQELPASGG
jgi:Tfp pilus assembly protein PilX